MVLTRDVVCSFELNLLKMLERTIPPFDAVEACRIDRVLEELEPEVRNVEQRSARISVDVLSSETARR